MWRVKFRAHNKTINVGREVNLGLFVGALLRPYTQPATAVVILYFGSFMCGDDKEERRRPSREVSLFTLARCGSGRHSGNSSRSALAIVEGLIGVEMDCVKCL